MTLSLVLSTALMWVSTASASTLLFDFGRTDLQTPGNWNNVVPATTVLNGLVCSDGDVSALSLEITDPFFDIAEPSSVGSEAPFGAAGSFPVSATDDYFFGHTGPFAGGETNILGQLKLSNLDPNTSYTFTFFAARTGVSDNRETRYSVAGATSGSVLLNPSNNESEVARIFQIEPDLNNEIFIDVERGPNNDNGSRFYYLGVMRVDTRPIPEPSTSLTLLGAAFLLLTRRRRK